MVNKIFEPLETLLMAYESRLKSREPIEKQWEKYLDLELEKSKLAICICLVKITQTLLEHNQAKAKENEEPK